MLKLNTSLVALGATTNRHLTSKQSIINGLAAGLQAGRAQTLWDAKSGSKAGKAAFVEVKQRLITLCVSTELCNYCEHNEATDIEHIYPKSFFPERTFQWSNYLLACKQCNTAYKLDQFAVFVPALSANAVALQRGSRPTTIDAAFIDPRVDDPMHYLYLDITAKSFQLIPHPDRTDPRDIAKAERTLDVLQIGQRASLAKVRLAAFNFYQERLERYKKVTDATTFDDLENLVQDPNLVDQSKPFEEEKQTMLDGLKQSILEHIHPTVWREMQRQHLHLKNVRKLFEDVPDALQWK